MSGKQGLSPNSSMSDKMRDEIHAEGGKASHNAGKSSQKGGNVIRNHEGGGALDKAAQRKGGRSSRNKNR